MKVDRRGFIEATGAAVVAFFTGLMRTPTPVAYVVVDKVPVLDSSRIVWHRIKIVGRID